MTTMPPTSNTVHAYRGRVLHFLHDPQYRERDAYEATIISQRGTDMKMNLVNARAKLVSRAIVDADGKPLFADEDVALLANKSAAAIERVFNVAQKLSGMSKDDIEDLTKNSMSVQGVDSGSA